MGSWLARVNRASRRHTLIQVNAVPDYLRHIFTGRSASLTRAAYPAVTKLLPDTPIDARIGKHLVSEYPPFSYWSSRQIEAVHAALETEAGGAALNLYVHIPFCRQRCQYCYFRAHAHATSETVDRYLTALLHEFLLYEDRRAIRGRPFRAVRFGGGTASYLSERQIERLFAGLRASDDWEFVTECTCEIEPGTAPTSKYRLLSEMGVTRLNLGMQTLDDHVLQYLGRNFTATQCVQAYDDARAAGFDEISIDLLVGLPGETQDSWNRTLDQALELEPDCVTIHQLGFTRHSTARPKAAAPGEFKLPDWPTQIARAYAGFERLEEAGFTVVSGSTAVRDPARWRLSCAGESASYGEDFLALGQTAFGHLRGVLYQNVHSYDAYTGYLANHRVPLYRAYELTEDERFRREVILQLKLGRLEPAYFQQKYNRSIANEFAAPFGELMQRGYLELGPGGDFHLSREALLQVDWLLPALYLPAHRQAPQF